MKIKFVDFKETPNEKHIGIATVNFEDKIYLRFKVMPRKDGPGYYCVTSAFKISPEEYIPSFVIDSNYLKEQIELEIKKNVENYIIKKTSVFDQDIPF